MITAKQAFDALVSYNPKLTITSCVDYDKEHYVFSATENPDVADYNAPYFGVNKNTGEVTSFTPGEDFDAFFDAVDNRSIDISQFLHSDKSDYLVHYGILGMKWGVRRYQNPDGTYTEAGKKRYSMAPSTRELNDLSRKIQNNVNDNFRKVLNTDKAIEDERSRFKEWERLREELDYLDSDGEEYKTLKKRWQKLEDADPYYEIERNIISDLERELPGLSDTQRSEVADAMQEVFDINIWTPALTPYPEQKESEKKKSGVGSKIADALIDVGKSVATAAFTKRIVG